MIVGVLALQGDFHAHGQMFERLGVRWRAVRTPSDFDEIEGLVIPGGESTTLLKLLTPSLKGKILALAKRGGPLFGTCAGALLLARKVSNPSQASLGLLDAEMVRNDYGRKVDSFVLLRGEDGAWGKEVPQEMVFIRAPLFKALGPGVRVLASARDAPVYVQQDHILASTFHPELSMDTTIHRRFVAMIHERIQGACMG